VSVTWVPVVLVAAMSAVAVTKKYSPPSLPSSLLPGLGDGMVMPANSSQ
jgi:hypothetical protein